MACFVLRRALLSTDLPDGVARLAFASVALNPFALIYTGYLLTESFSLSLEVLLLAALTFL